MASAGEDSGARSWEGCAHLIASAQLFKLVRHADVMAQYQAHRNVVNAKYARMADYLLEQTFGYALAADEDGKMRAVKPAAGPGAQKVWRPNDFPYLLQPGIEHHIIWCEAGSITDQEVQEVLARERAGWETLVFENPPALRTVPELHHIHVFSRLPA